MIKKIRSEELIVGMFIHDLNCSWLNHPFFKGGKSIRVDNREIIKKVIEYNIKEVYIDTDKGLDLGDIPEKRFFPNLKKKLEKLLSKSLYLQGAAAVNTKISAKGSGAEIVPEKNISAGSVSTQKTKTGNVSNVIGVTEKDTVRKGPDDVHLQEAKPAVTEEKIEKPAKKKSALTTDVSINEEILNAKKIKKETIQTVRKIMDDIKLGKPIQKERVEEDVENIIESVFRNSDALVGLARLRTITDYLYSHSLSVCVMMVTFAKYLGYDSQTIKDIGLGAMLHDIGAGMVSQRIINKEKGLTKDEYESVKEHVRYGYDILLETKGISEKSLMTMYQHHERIDGTGYPHGLKGDEISQFGQAIAIVDVYDALTTKRSYRHKIQPTEALRMIYQWRGDEFNPDLVEHFIRCIGIYPAGTLVCLESGLLGIVVCHKGEDLLKPVLRIVYDTKKDKYLMPYDVDLSNPSENSAGDRIVSYEQPDRWNVQSEMYL